MASIGSILLSRLKSKGAGRLVSELNERKKKAAQENGPDTTVSIAGEDPIQARRESVEARRLSDFAGPNEPAMPEGASIGQPVMGRQVEVVVGRPQFESAPPQRTGTPASAGAPDQEFVQSLQVAGLELPQAAALARSASAGASSAEAAEGLGSGPLLSPEDQALLDQTGAPPATAQAPQRREPAAQMASVDPFAMARERLASAGGRLGGRLRQLRQGGLSQEEAIAQASDEGLIDQRLARRMLGIAQAGQ